MHKSLWKKIAKYLSVLGFKATAVQCMNKWKALKREYKKTMDNNAQTGSEKLHARFFFSNLGNFMDIRAVLNSLDPFVFLLETVF